MTRAYTYDGSESPCHRWLVLVACFMCHMTSGSMSYHLGVLHVALLDAFGQDVVTTAWLGSVYSCLPSLIGPVASLIITTFNCRTCLVMSGLLSAMGMSSCFFITRFIFLYPALIVAGIGQGFALVTSYIAIGYNFPHQASLLTGICVCGSGLGIFVHPPLLQTLIDVYGLHGALLILGAVSLNTVACGLAIPPSKYEVKRPTARPAHTTRTAPRQGVSSTFHVARKREHQGSGSYVSVTPSQDSTTRRLQTQAYSSGDFKTSSTCSTAAEPKRSSIASVSMRESGLHNSGSLPSLDGGCCLLRTKSKHDGKRPCGEPGHNQGLSSREDIKRRTDDSAKTGAGGDCSIPLMAVNQPEEDCVSRTAVQQSNQDCTTSLIVEKSKQDCVCPTSAQPPAEDCRTPLMAVNQPAHERSSDAAVRQPRHDCSCARVNVTRDRSRHAYTPNSKEAFHRRSSDAVKHPSNASSLANVTEPNPGSSTRSIVVFNPPDQGHQRPARGPCRALCTSHHLVVLADPRFSLLLFTSFGFSSALACYYIYLPDFLLHNHYDHLTASFVMSATGMGSIPARLLTGVVSNDARVDTITVFYAIHALAALATLLVPCFAGSVVAQMVLAAVFGIYTGAVWAAYSPLLLELLGMRKVADGVGLYLFTMGVGYLAGPPLAGSLYTASDNFHHVFYFTAAMFALGSLAAMLSTLVKAPSDHRRHPITTTTNTTIFIEADDNDDSSLASVDDNNITTAVEINNQRQGRKHSGASICSSNQQSITSDSLRGSDQHESTEDGMGIPARADTPLDRSGGSESFHSCAEGREFSRVTHSGSDIAQYGIDQTGSAQVHVDEGSVPACLDEGDSIC